MKNMDIHDGERVEKLVVQKGVKHTELADKIGIARSTLKSWFKKESWGTHELTKASKVLGVDLLKPYTDRVRTQHGIILLNEGDTSRAFTIEPLEELDEKNLLRCFKPKEP